MGLVDLESGWGGSSNCMPRSSLLGLKHFTCGLFSRILRSVLISSRGSWTECFLNVSSPLGPIRKSLGIQERCQVGLRQGQRLTRTTPGREEGFRLPLTFRFQLCAMRWHVADKRAWEKVALGEVRPTLVSNQTLQDQES